MWMPWIHRSFKHGILDQPGGHRRLAGGNTGESTATHDNPPCVDNDTAYQIEEDKPNVTCHEDPQPSEKYVLFNKLWVMSSGVLPFQVFCWKFIASSFSSHWLWILIITSVLQSHLQLNKMCICLPVVFKKPSSGCKPCLSNRFGNLALSANLWILLSLWVRECEEICQAAIDSAALGDLSNTLERSRMSRFRSSGSNPESGRMNLLSFWMISHAIEHIEWQFEEQSEHVKLWYFRNWTKELQSGTDSFTFAGWQEEGQSLEMHRPRSKADLWICLVPGLSRAHSQPSLCWRTSGHWSQAILSRRIGLCWDADWKWEGFNIYGESASVIAKMYCHAVSTSCFLCWHSSLKTSS